MNDFKAGPARGDPPSAVEDEILEVSFGLSQILVEKNRAYGNSALEPVRIFSRSSAEEQLLVRIDDKISRLVRGKEYPGDDTLVDLAGYLILLLVHRRMQKGKEVGNHG